MALSRSALFLILVLPSCSSLACFVTDNEGKNLRLVDSPLFSFCSLTPLSGDGRTRGLRSGVGDANGDFTGLKTLFAGNTKHVAIKAACFMEMYDFSVIPALNQTAPEQSFRCLCDRSGCNRRSTFSAFLRHNTRY